MMTKKSNRLPSIWKDYEDDSRWPYVLTKETQDTSFNPFNVDGCLQRIMFWTVVLLALGVVMWMLTLVLQLLGIVGPQA